MQKSQWVFVSNFAVAFVLTSPSDLPFKKSYVKVRPRRRHGCRRHPVSPSDTERVTGCVLALSSEMKLSAFCLNAGLC